jgi:type IX secretion system PorP/SprF family membrane protein
MKTAFYTTLFLIFTKTVGAQDIHWSQNLVSYMGVNPALTGVVKGDYDKSLVIQHRNQWASVLNNYAYQTQFMSADKRFFLGKNYCGLGAMLTHDEAGEAMYDNLQAHISGSYIQHLFKNRENIAYLMGGMQIGGGRQRLDFSQVTWSQQFDKKDFNRLIPSGETMFVTDRPLNHYYADVSTGVAFGYVNSKMSNKRFRWVFGGIGLHHLGDVLRTRNTNRSFQPDSILRLNAFKTTLHAEMGIRGFGGGVVPSIVVQNQAELWKINVGVVHHLHVNKDLVLKTGVYCRMNDNAEKQWTADALAFLIGLDFKALTVMSSYDMNVSSLQPASQSRGGFELSLILRGFSLDNKGNTKTSSSVFCPELF